MGLDDSPDETQSKAKASLGAAGVTSKQPIPNPRQLVRTDSNTGVLDRQHNLPILAADCHVDASPRGRIFNGVVDQIGGDLFETLLPVALAHWTNHGSRIHGPEHWRRVAENGLQLVVETPGADAEIVQTFAALHDSQRQNDGGDPQHGARAAELARTLALELDDAQLELLYFALSEHPHGLTSDDPSVGCCWDADRLDLVRLGRQPRAELMSTEAGKRLVS